MAGKIQAKMLSVEPPQVGLAYLSFKGQDRPHPCIEVRLTTIPLRIREESGDPEEENICLSAEEAEQLAHDLLDATRRLKRS